MKNYLELNKENLILRSFLQDCLKNEDHAYYCDFILSNDVCNCWLLDAKAMLSLGIEETVAGGLSRHTNVDLCKNCKHPKIIHNCKIGDEIACSSSNCGCSAYSD